MELSEFIRRVIAGGPEGLPDSEVEHYIEGLSINDLESLHKFIYEEVESKWIAESFFGDSLSKHECELNRLQVVKEAILTRMESQSNNTLDFLTERGENAFNKSIEIGLIEKDGENYRWLKSKAALSNWVEDMCTVGGVTTKMSYGKNTDWKSFERLFNVKNLAQTSQKSDHNNACRDYDEEVRKLLFPDI